VTLSPHFGSACIMAIQSSPGLSHADKAELLFTRHL
jgi:hypothetical protein